MRGVLALFGNGGGFDASQVMHRTMRAWIAVGKATPDDMAEAIKARCDSQGIKKNPRQPKKVTLKIERKPCQPRPQDAEETGVKHNDRLMMYTFLLQSSGPGENDPRGLCALLFQVLTDGQKKKLALLTSSWISKISGEGERQSSRSSKKHRSGQSGGNNVLARRSVPMINAYGSAMDNGSQCNIQGVQAGPRRLPSNEGTDR